MKRFFITLITFAFLPPLSLAGNKKEKSSLYHNQIPQYQYLVNRPYSLGINDKLIDDKFRKIIDTGYTYGMTDYPYHQFELLTSGMIRTRFLIFAGIGTGVQFHWIDKNKLTATPLYAHFRYYLRPNNPNSFFLDFKWGVAFSYKKEFGNMEFRSPGIGSRIHLTDKMGLNILLACTFQKIEEPVYLQDNMIAISLKAGIEF